MRYVKVRVTPTEGDAFHPLGQQLADEPTVTREAIHRIELLEDGTGVMLAEARGDRKQYEDILSNSTHIIEYSLAGDEGRWYSYTHFEPTALTRRMVRRERESEVMMEMPVYTAEDGSLEITFVGDKKGFGRATPAETDVYDIEVLETGDRHSLVDDLFASLTARQQEVLDAAVRLGYYQNPRNATHADISEVTNISPSTVGEHLRKIESRVFSEFIREGRNQ
jgi:predicted DNA binding protein